MTIRRTVGAACAVAALIGMSGAAYAGDSGGYTRTYGKDKVEIYVSVKSGAYADVDYQTKHGGGNYGNAPAFGFQSINGIYGQKPQIKEETAKAWGQVKKVKIEAQGVTSGTWDAHYSSEASTHSKTGSSGGQQGGGGYSATSSPGGGDGCGCSSSSSTTSASASGGTSGSWSTGGGGSSGGKD